MTIDVADLRKRAERTFPQVYPSELTELLDAYEERDRLRAEREIPEGMEEVIEWARRHPEYMWQENQRNENEVTRLEAERDRLRAALQEIKRGVDHPLGIVGAPAFYEAMEWASTIANAALEGRE